MKEQDKIPTSKVKRAAKLLSAGAKVGTNYLKYYAKKAYGVEHAKEQLDKDNAEDLFETLSELKGSALKVAQIMSMDKNMLPAAITEKFAMAQYNAPPLSYPLVLRTFKKAFGKSPLDIFCSFSKKAIKAASIGQVHMAEKNGKKLAVKVQYPGVADSVKNDLRMVKPIAMRILNLKENEIRQYLEEVEERLIEETNYELELKQSIEISLACKDLDGFIFPNYYPELSSDKILTMDWLDGTHLKDYLKTNPDQKIRNLIGQRLWDFYDFQVNELKAIHADPHPGNFLFFENGNIGVIDFGCIKRIPLDFYHHYFQLLNPVYQNDDALLMELFYQLEFIYKDDTPETKKLFFDLFKEIMFLLIKPFKEESFDFSNKEYLNRIYQLGDELKSRKDIRKNGAARGSRHILYINRTYFGLFTLLYELGANVKTNTSFDFSKV